MTAESYRRSVKLGVTGPETATCFAAAADLVSIRSSVSPETYIAYDEAFWDQYYNGPNNTRSKETFAMVLRDLGVGSLKGFIERRVRNAEDCETVLEKLRQGGFRVIIYTQDDHVVGLYPKKRGWQMRGTHIPGDSEREYRASELFLMLAQPSGKDLGKPKPNILAIVSEPKR